MKTSSVHTFVTNLAIAVSLYIVTCLSTIGQTPPVKTSLAQDLARTFGFCKAQRASIAQMRRMYPELETQAILAELEWNSAFKDAETNVETRLKNLLPEQWDKMEAKMIADLEPVVKGQNSKATREIAAQFLEMIPQRAKGVLESPIREMLLASHPRYIQSPEQEFGRGYTGTFSSKGRVKAKGVELTIRYPLSWKQFEADRPNIVQKWTSDGGHGTDVFMVQIRKLPEVLNSEEKSELFTAASAKEMFEEDGSKVISFTSSKLERQPVGIVHVTQTVQRLDISLEVHAIFYYLIYEDAFIALQFMCYTPGGPEAMEARLKQLEPLTKAIAGSLVLQESYR